MKVIWAIPVLASILILLIGSTQEVAAASITIGSASPFIGPVEERSGFPFPQNAARPYDTTNNLAFQGGLAEPAVASNSISIDPFFANIHKPEFANDGFYGNGASWIPTLFPSAGEWLKIDLGDDFVIETITFGRDRLGFFDDRDPGQFIIEISSNDLVYANGNDVDDSAEYIEIVDSSALSFSGVINGPETIQVSFDPVNARFIKVTFTFTDLVIDEIQVFGAAVPEEQAQNLIEDVETLLPDSKDGTKLTTSLDKILKALDNEDTVTACDQLNKFIKDIQKLIDKGKLDEPDGQALIDSANDLKDAIPC